jgi:hypothetical protein
MEYEGLGFFENPINIHIKLTKLIHNNSIFVCQNSAYIYIYDKNFDPANLLIN